jgi:hypothetical protein
MQIFCVNFWLKVQCALNEAYIYIYNVICCVYLQEKLQKCAACNLYGGRDW